MAWDNEHLWQLFDSVASTSGHASVQKSEELLNYVTNKTGETNAKEIHADAAESEKELFSALPASEKDPDSYRTDDR